jgi:adenosylhomocysteine nucleosidase
MKFLVITPLQEEVHFLVQSFRSQGFSEKMQSLGRLTVHCFPELDLTIAQGGHGKAQCALQTQHLLDCAPSFDGVICMGAAGALSPLVAVGDIVIAETTIEHDYILRFVQRPIPQFAGAPHLLAHLRSTPLSLGAFRAHYGVIASGDEDIVSIERAEALRSYTHGLAVAWEGAGVARACLFNRIPFLEIRGITDTADHTAPGDFETNLEVAMANLGSFFVQSALKDLPQIA